MSNKDLKLSLRTQDFPECCKEALPYIENLIISRSKQNWVLQLISEFVFMERGVDARKGSAPLPLSTLQQCQLLLVLIDYFSQPGPDATRNVVFLSLFNSNLTPQRAKILCMLVSCAVAGKVAPLLLSAGTWMQQVGCTKERSLQVAQSLVSDYVLCSRRTSEQLSELPLIAPHFSAHFMTAVADLYLNDQHARNMKTPPDALLDVFTQWVKDYPQLCLASAQPLALPNGAIVMPFVTPLAGLIRWTVLAPMVSERAVYAVLHLSLMKTLRQLKNDGQPFAIDAQHLMLIVNMLNSYADSLNAAGKVPTKDAIYNSCMDRFAQATQVALSFNCVYGNIPQLLLSLESLPSHAVMSLVISQNRSALIK